MRPNPTATAPALDDGRPIRRLVIPSVEGSLHDHTTLLGVLLGEAWGVPVELVHVTPSIASDDPELEDLARQLQSHHPDLEVGATHLYGDDPAVAIADHVTAGSLVVMSTDHIDAWRIKGSVAEALLDRVGAPVLLLGPHVTLEHLRTTGLNGEVVVGVDGSAAAEAGVGPAVALATSIGQRLWLVQVMSEDEPSERFHPEVGRRLQELAEGSDDETTTRWEVILDNDPVDALHAFATRREASFLVVTRRARTSTDRRSMASIAAGVAAVATRPVLVLTAPEVPAVGDG